VLISADGQVLMTFRMVTSSSMLRYYRNTLWALKRAVSRRVYRTCDLGMGQ